MDRWAGKTAVVTGASAGIGASITVALANAGVNVVGFARRPQLIDKLQDQVSGKGKIHSYACDISNYEQIAESFKWVDDNFGGTDIIVNNAALIYHGDITAFGPLPLTDLEIAATIDVNVRGTIICTRHAVESMKRTGTDGHVININSVAGHYVPFQPLLNIYSSSKFAITAFTESLLSELSQYGQKIRVTSISPGLVDTQMAELTRMPDLANIAKMMPKLQPTDVADAVMYAISAPPTVNISEIKIQTVGEKKI